MQSNVLSFVMMALSMFKSCITFAVYRLLLLALLQVKYKRNSDMNVYFETVQRQR